MGFNEENANAMPETEGNIFNTLLDWLPHQSLDTGILGIVIGIISILINIWLQKKLNRTKEKRP